MTSRVSRIDRALVRHLADSSAVAGAQGSGSTSGDSSFASVSWQTLHQRASSLERELGKLSSRGSRAERAKRADRKRRLAAVKEELTARNPSWQQIDRIKASITRLQRGQAEALSNAYFMAHKLDSNSNGGANLGIVMDAVAVAMDDTRILKEKARLKALRTRQPLSAQVMADVLLKKRASTVRALGDDFVTDRALTAGAAGRQGRQAFYDSQTRALQRQLADIDAALVRLGVTP